MVTDGALKLDYTPVWYSSILESKSVKLNLILFPQLLPAMRKVSEVIHVSKTMAQRRQSA